MSSCFQALDRPHVTPPASLDALAAFQHARRSAGSSGTARVYSLILFGFELRMLELHMRMLAPQVEKFLVAESTLTFQFGEKPAHLTEALRRGSIAPELAQKLRVDVVSPDELRAHCGGRLRHGDGLAVRCVETHQRARLFRLLFAVAADGDIALLSDVDEIAKPAALALLRRCPPFGANGSAPYKIVLESVDYKFGVHCLSKSRWTGLHAYSVGFLRAERSKIEDANGAAQWRLQVFTAPKLVNAGWHFSSFGTPQELKTKLSTWGHANLFDEADRSRSSASSAARAAASSRVEVATATPGIVSRCPCHSSGQSREIPRRRASPARRTTGGSQSPRATTSCSTPMYRRTCRPTSPSFPSSSRVASWSVRQPVAGYRVPVGRITSLQVACG